MMPHRSKRYKLIRDLIKLIPFNSCLHHYLMGDVELFMDKDHFFLMEECTSFHYYFAHLSTESCLIPGKNFLMMKCLVMMSLENFHVIWYSFIYLYNLIRQHPIFETKKKAVASVDDFLYKPSSSGMGRKFKWIGFFCQ